LSFYRSKPLWVATAVIFPLLLVAVNYGFKVMTSIYKQDFGNGVVVYADDYVNTGKWVFNCNNSRLIRREPLPVPIKELKEAGKLTIGAMYSLNRADEELAIVAIKAITKIDNWYKNLRYLYSGLDESSHLTDHDFDLLGRYDGRLWALQVTQSLDYRNRSSFQIIAEPYDPDTYMDYAKVLQAAAKSCAIPQ
jgi:hypothetical protein